MARDRARLAERLSRLINDPAATRGERAAALAARARLIPAEDPVEDMLRRVRVALGMNPDHEPAPLAPWDVEAEVVRLVAESKRWLAARSTPPPESHVAFHVRIPVLWISAHPSVTLTDWLHKALHEAMRREGFDMDREFEQHLFSSASLSDEYVFLQTRSAELAP